MGKAERQRRAAQERRAQERAQAQAGQGQAAGGGSASSRRRDLSHEEVVEAVVAAAAAAWVAKDLAEVDRVIQLLVSQPDVGGWRADAERLVQAALTRAVARAWGNGWQPADVVRYAGRVLGGPQVRLLTDVIAGELAQYAAATIDPRWLGQLDTLGAAVWWTPDRTVLRAVMEARHSGDWTAVMGHAIEVLCLLTTLPRLEALTPLPGQYRAATGSAGDQQPRPEVDEKILARIRALLAKAEATTSEAEAEAFTAGAQERMARYSIDLAMLEANDPNRPRTPSGRRIGIDNPYEASKAVLLDKVAHANRCQSVWFKEQGFCTVVGFDADLAAVEALFTSLLVQAVTAMNRAGQRTGPGARSRTRSFRQSFLVAYASRIGERLAEITTAQAGAASARPGGSEVLPVLASRTLAVEQEVSRLFPVLRQHSAGSVTDSEGWHSGRASADLATLSAAAAVDDQRGRFPGRAR
jgi:Protein of unknown function (DUF2786)